MEILPRWGILKTEKYAAGMYKNTYFNVVAAARWIYDRMLSQERGPEKCYVSSHYTNLNPPPPSDLPVRSYISHLYLQFKNIRERLAVKKVNKSYEDLVDANRVCRK